MQSYTNGNDLLSQLPTDSSQPSPQEQAILNTLFAPEHKTGLGSIILESRDSILVGILFVIFSLPQTNEIIYKIVPSAATSIYIIMAIKMVAFMLLFWVIKHFYLARKN